MNVVDVTILWYVTVNNGGVPNGYGGYENNGGYGGYGNNGGYGGYGNNNGGYGGGEFQETDINIQNYGK